MSVFSFRSTVAKGFAARSAASRWRVAVVVATFSAIGFVAMSPTLPFSSFVVGSLSKEVTLWSVPSSLSLSIPSAWADAKEETKGDGKAQYKSALAKVKQARYASAIEDLKKALKGNDKNADFWSLYGFAARKVGSYDLAEQAYARALSLNPKHLGALEYSGELYVETQRPEEARKRLARLVALCPQGCRERTLLEQAIKGQANDGTHKW